tara:strand:+ start:770 stop:1255 length:486 start_codon:yes stop_codon:yes gene_type:complete
MANSDFNIKGQKELRELFKNLPKKVDNPRVWAAIWRKNAKPLVKAAQSKALALGGTGQLSRSIGFFSTKASRKEGGGYVGPRIRGAFAKKDASGKYSKSGYYGAFVEYGNFRYGPGKAQAFMQPAFVSTKDLMLVSSLADAKKVLEREAKKLAKWGTLGYR